MPVPSADVAIPETSTSDCRKLSPAQCRLFPGIGGSLNSRFQIVIGIVPLWGFGTFSSSSTVQSQNNPYGNPGLIFNVSWPAVYMTLTETWTNTYTGGFGGPPPPSSLTIVSQWTNYFDTGLQISQSGTGVLGYSAPISTLSISALSITGTQTNSLPFSGTVTITYTATLSNPAPSYSSLVGGAHAMLGNATLPAILPFTGNPQTQNRSQMVFPISTSPGYAIADTANSTAAYPNVAFDNLVAAAYGVAVQLASINPTGSMPNLFVMFTAPPTNYPIPPIGQYAFEKAIDDLLLYPGYSGNIGGVVCIKSRWRLNGSGSGVPGPLLPAETNHQQINGQKMDFSGAGGAPNLLSVITPGSFQNANQVSANGTLYADPLVAFPQELEFLDTDVGANLYSGASTQYGVLGFRSVPI